VIGVQLVPLPTHLAAGISPQGAGVLARLEADATGAVRDDPAGIEEARSRIVLTADRATTLRVFFQCATLLALFCIVGVYVDQLRHTRLVLNSVIAGFAITTTIVILQLVGESPGAFGLWNLDRGPAWSATSGDLLDGPIISRLRIASNGGAPERAWLVRRPVVPFAIGPLVAGPGAYLALTSIALPLLISTILQRLNPRGSAESLSNRLRHAGGVPALAVLISLSAASACLAGFLGGRLLGAVVCVGILVTCVLSARGTGMGRSCLTLALLLVAFITLGDQFAGFAKRPTGTPWIAEAATWPKARGLWSDAVFLGRSFPILGVGAGAFASLEPYLKTTDETSSTCQNTLLQMWAELGGVGVSILALALLWCLARLPSAWRSLGSADRPLAAGLLGAFVGLLLLSSVHWTIQQPSVALVGVLILGTMNRWLAGATDLFVEPAAIST
jgi:hypothetical protein